MDDETAVEVTSLATLHKDHPEVLSDLRDGIADLANQGGHPGQQEGEVKAESEREIDADEKGATNKADTIRDTATTATTRSSEDDREVCPGKAAEIIQETTHEAVQQDRTPHTERRAPPKVHENESQPRLKHHPVSPETKVRSRAVAVRAQWAAFITPKVTAEMGTNADSVMRLTLRRRARLSSRSGKSTRQIKQRRRWQIPLLRKAAVM